MTEVDLLDSFSYAFEQAWSNLRWWASVSFGLVALVTIGRKYLSLAIKVAVSLLFALFSLFSWLNTQVTIVIASGHITQLIEMSNAVGVGPSWCYGALPPNKGMQLTVKRVTPFAFAKAAPLLLAADPRS